MTDCWLRASPGQKPVGFNPNSEVETAGSAEHAAGARRSRRSKLDWKNTVPRLLKWARFCGLKAALLALGFPSTSGFGFNCLTLWFNCGF